MFHWLAGSLSECRRTLLTTCMCLFTVSMAVKMQQAIDLASVSHVTCFDGEVCKAHSLVAEPWLQCHICATYL